MDDDRTLTVLRNATAAAVRDHHLEPGAATSAWTAAHAPQRRRGPLIAAVAATVVVTAGAAIAVASWPAHHRAAQRAGGGSACAHSVVDGPLPTWARAGFTPADQAIRHVMGEHGRIVAVLFVPLRVHQPKGTSNKVLWVARGGYGPLRIDAALEGSATRVTRTLPNGPGPSYVDLPAAGCWRLDLHWGGTSDRLALAYAG